MNRDRFREGFYLSPVLFLVTPHLAKAQSVLLFDLG